VRVAVTDRGADIGPIAQRGEAATDRGFGLQLVDRMADRWWIEDDAGTPRRVRVPPPPLT